MSEDDALKLMLHKLDLLRNFLIVADDGLRQQHSAMNDEIIAVMKDIRSELNDWIRKHK